MLDRVRWKDYRIIIRELEIEVFYEFEELDHQKQANRDQ